jgi:hypothetical protein
MGTEGVFEGRETGEEVLNRIRTAGYKLNNTQLARRHRAGLISGVEVRALGRGRGSVSLYPVGTGARLIRTIELAGPGRPIFEKVAWRVWWEDGGQLVPLVRERLRQEAANWESELSRLADLLAAEDAGEQTAVAEMEKTYTAASEERMPTTLGQVRRNVGRGRFTTVFRVLAEVATGSFEGYQDEEAELAFEKALGIDHARTDRLAGGEPWFEGSSAQDLKQLSGVFGRRSLSDLADAADDDLEKARREVYVFFQIFEALASSIGAVLAGDALGLGTVTAVFGSRPEKLQPFFVLMWLALREDPVLHEGMLKTMAALPDALAARDAFEAIRVMRAEVPALSTVMTDEALGAALLDAERGKRLRAEIAEVSSMNQGTVDRFFEQHPEVAAILEA